MCGFPLEPLDLASNVGITLLFVTYVSDLITTLFGCFLNTLMTLVLNKLSYACYCTSKIPVSLIFCHLYHLIFLSLCYMYISHL